MAREQDNSIYGTWLAALAAIAGPAVWAHCAEGQDFGQSLTPDENVGGIIQAAGYSALTATAIIGTLLKKPSPQVVPLQESDFATFDLSTLVQREEDYTAHVI